MKTAKHIALGAAALLLIGQGCVRPAPQEETSVNNAMPVPGQEGVPEMIVGSDIQPSISVENQTLVEGRILVRRVSAAEPSWIVIHADDEGKPGQILGSAQVPQGDENVDIEVTVDKERVTPTLFAMLHRDLGQTGVFEFPGVDVPTLVGDQPLMASFQATAGAMMEKKPEPSAMMEKNVKSFSLIAKQWAFEPATITVKKGDRVKLSIKSTDVAHGFSLPAFNIKERLEPNQMVNVEFVADKSGTFPFVCSVACGSGHGAMKGSLIVE